MSPVLVIAAKDLRQRLRDRSALVLGFLAPLLIATVMSLAFRGSESFHTTVGVVNRDHGPLGAAFVAMLRSPGISDVVSPRLGLDQAQARAQVDSGALGAAYVLPRGFTAAAHGAPVAVHLVVLGSADQAIARQVAQSLAQSFAAQLNADRLSVVTATASGAPPSQLPRLVAASARLRLPLATSSTNIGGKQLTAISYYAPSMGIFFVLFGIGFGARSIWAERRARTQDRVLASPAPPSALLAGKAVSTMVFALASLTTMFVVTSTAFGADWGPLPGAAALAVAMSAATAALMALVSTLARTERQADGVAATVTFGLVLLGGNFVFLSAAPALLRTLALVTPNGWAMRGFVDMQSGLGSGAVVVPVLAILAFAAVAAGTAGALSRRALLS